MIHLPGTKIKIYVNGEEYSREEVILMMGMRGDRG